MSAVQSITVWPSPFDLRGNACRLTACLQTLVLTAWVVFLLQCRNRQTHNERHHCSPYTNNSYHQSTLLANSHAHKRTLYWQCQMLKLKLSPTVQQNVLTLSNMKKSSAARAPNMSPMISIRMPANTAPPYPLLNICELVTMPLDRTDNVTTASIQNNTFVYQAFPSAPTPRSSMLPMTAHMDNWNRFFSLYARSLVGWLESNDTFTYTWRYYASKVTLYKYRNSKHTPHNYQIYKVHI